MRVTSPFGPRGDGFHGALDIGNARLGDRIIAVGDGKIIAAGYLGWPWSTKTTRYPSGNFGGMMAILQLAPQVVAIYAHMQPKLYVTTGQLVKRGQLIGLVGDTGSAAAPPLGGGGHLHFGIQAPSRLVPAGVKTQSTSFGYGLDVDPWPLITGQAELLEEDMKLQGKFLAHVMGERTSLTVRSNFRSAPSMAPGTILTQFNAGEAFIPVVMVEGASVGTDAAKAIWYGGFLWVDGGYTFGYFHQSVLKQPFTKVSDSLLTEFKNKIETWVAARPR